MKRFFVLAAFVLLSAGAERAKADIITGPILNIDSNQNNSGIEITANTNTVIQSLVLQNQGGADSIQLLTVPVAGSGHQPVLLYSLPVAAGNPTYNATNLNWQLTAGESYYLVGNGNANGKFAYPPGYPDNITPFYPVSDGQITVDTGIFGNYAPNVAWGDFNDITTTSAVPEPSSFMLLLLVVIVGFCVWRSIRRKTGENPVAC